LKINRLLLTLLISAMPLAATARVDCTIFEALERIQFAQSRLKSATGSRTTSKDSGLIISEMRRLDTDQASFAGYGELSQSELVFLRTYVESAFSLSSMLLRDDSIAISAYFGQPRFESYQTRIAQILPRLNCNLLTGAGGQNGTQRSLKGGKSDLTARQFSIPAASIIFAMTIVGMLIAQRAYKAFARWQGEKERQSRRFKTHIQTRFSADGQLRDGVLLDLSCNGTKIQSALEPNDLVGREIQVWIGNSWYRANIRWHNLHYIGANFRVPLPITFVQSCISESHEVSLPP
jgi:hypothetical protein